MFGTDLEYTDKSEMILCEALLTIFFLCLCSGIGAFAAGLWTGNTNAYVAAAIAWAFPSLITLVGMLGKLFKNHND